MYHSVNIALRNQLIASVPDVYIRSLKHATTGYGNIKALAILTHLFSTYGKIDSTEIDANLARMRQPWNPSSPIEQLYLQLQDGPNFAQAAGEVVEDSQLWRMAFNNVNATGLFERACDN